MSVLDKTINTLIAKNEDTNSIGSSLSFEIKDSSHEYYVGFASFTSEQYFEEIMLNYGSQPLPYEPYISHRYPIPQSIINREEYGVGINKDIYNYIDFDKKTLEVPCSNELVLNGSEVWKVSETAFKGINRAIYGFTTEENAPAEPEKINTSSTYIDITPESLYGILRS